MDYVGKLESLVVTMTGETLRVESKVEGNTVERRIREGEDNKMVSYPVDSSPLHL